MSTAERLEYLRGEIRAERISYGEIAELQSLAGEIDPGDTELLEWAGVPEFPDDDDTAEAPPIDTRGPFPLRDGLMFEDW